MPRGARRGTALFYEELFDDAVFQAVERDHRQAPFRLENGERRPKAALQLAQFVIHMNAQGLEGAGGGMYGVAQRGRALRLGDKVRQLRGCGERTGGDDATGDAAGVFLLAQPGDHRGQHGMIGAIDEIGRRRAGQTHAHVQWAVFAERKAARRCVKLEGRHAQIQHDAVAGTGQRVHTGKFAFDQSEAAFELLHQRLAAGYGFGIAVNAQHFAIGGFQNGPAVTAAAESTVNVMAAVFGAERRDHFRQHHRPVFCRIRRAHEFSSRARSSFAFMRATASASTGP
jgi:hypothetical protein